MDSKRDSERRSECERRIRETARVTDGDGESNRETEVELEKREGKRQTDRHQARWMEVSWRTLEGSPIQMFLTHICITLLLEDPFLSYW